MNLKFINNLLWKLLKDILLKLNQSLQYMVLITHHLKINLYLHQFPKLMIKYFHMDSKENSKDFIIKNYFNLCLDIILKIMKIL